MRYDETHEGRARGITHSIWNTVREHSFAYSSSIHDRMGEGKIQACMHSIFSPSLYFVLLRYVKSILLALMLGCRTTLRGRQPAVPWPASQLLAVSLQIDDPLTHPTWGSAMVWLDDLNITYLIEDSNNRP